MAITVDPAASAVKRKSTPPPTRKPSGDEKPKPVPASESDRTEALTGIVQLAQMPLIATRQFADAGAVAQYGPMLAKEIAKLAGSQEKIAQLVDPLVRVGPYTGLIAVLLPFAIQIGVNHNRLAPGAMGTVPRDTLASQIEAGLAQNELEALKIQRDAEKQAAEVRAEIQAQRDALNV